MLFFLIYLNMDMALSINNNILRKAKSSIDKKHRYELSRHWDLSKSDILFIMLNPSIANENIDDPTIKRLINFTKKIKFKRVECKKLFFPKMRENCTRCKCQNKAGS